MVPLALLALLALAPPPEPSAFDMLDQSHRAYQALTAYADAGEIAVETAGGGEARFRFETRSSPYTASYVLERLGDESPDAVERPAVWALWRSGEGFFLYDGKSDTYRAVASAEAGLIEMLGADRRAAALVAFELLAGPRRRPSRRAVGGERGGHARLRRAALLVGRFHSARPRATCVPGSTRRRG